MGLTNLRVYKNVFVPVTVAATLGLTACGGNADLKSVDFSTLSSIEEVKDVTIMDELTAEGTLKYDESMDLTKAADQLDKYMRIVEETDKVDLTDVDKLQPLSDEEYESLLSDINSDSFNVSLTYVRILKEDANYKGNDVLKLETKLSALKKLNYLHNVCREWVYANGTSISESIMMVSVKASVASELNMTSLDGITISPRPSSGEPDDIMITAGDKQYRVTAREGEIWNTINYLYELQGADLESNSQENRFKTYDKALNYAKTTIAAGSNVKNDRLVAQYSAKYIEGNLIR